MPYPKLEFTNSSAFSEATDVFAAVEPPSIETRVKYDGDANNGVRVYKVSPEHVGIQLRTFGPVNGQYGRRAGVDTAAYSMLSVDRVGLNSLIATLSRFRDMLPDPTKPHAFVHSSGDAEICHVCDHYHSNRKLHPKE